MQTNPLFVPLRVGALELSHRVVMAPLTRMRSAQPGNVPQPMNVEYYRQRASSGGLIIAEATQVCPEGQGFPQTPGIHTDAQIAGWRAITDAVHAEGGHIFLQLWHVGRVSHSSFQAGGRAPVAPSAVAAEGDHYTADWTFAPFQTPRALETHEVWETVDAYRRGASNAREAGFDGVELHGANGYLIEQFMQSRSNKRGDEFGGSVAHRCRFLIETVRAVVGVWGADRVGVRFSPFGSGNGSGEDDWLPLYRHAVAALSTFDLAYLHLIEPRIIASTDKGEEWLENAPSAPALFRDFWPGTLLVAGGYDGASAERVVAEGLADAVVFGRSFISTPDLPERLRLGVPINPWHRPTFYGGGEEGYLDYPTMGASLPSAAEEPRATSLAGNGGLA